MYTTRSEFCSELTELKHDFSAVVLVYMSGCTEHPLATPADEQRLWDACEVAARKQAESDPSCTLTGPGLYQSVYAATGGRKLSVRGINARIAVLSVGCIDQAIHI